MSATKATTRGKAEIVDGISENTEIPKTTVTAVLDDFVAYLTETLTAGDEFAYPGLGKFTAKTRAARQGVNPATGERITISPKRAAKFTPAAALKRSVSI